jgi:hypothetical protein
MSFYHYAMGSNCAWKIQKDSFANLLPATTTNQLTCIPRSRDQLNDEVSVS